MAMGMTYQEYWYGDVCAVRAFLEAENLRWKRSQQETNATAHLFGAYFYEALIDVAPVLNAFAKKGAKPRQYRSEPYKLAGQEKQKELSPKKQAEKEDAEVRRARAYMMQMDMVGKNWGKR